MDADLFKNLIGLASASVPLIIVVISLFKSQKEQKNLALDTSELKILKIVRYPVDEETWKAHKKWFATKNNMISYLSVVYLPIIFLEFILMFNYIIIIITFIIIIAFFNVMLLRVGRNFDIRFGNAIEGRYFLFKKAEITFGCDYYYLINKCIAVLKAMELIIVDVDDKKGYLEAFQLPPWGTVIPRWVTAIKITVEIEKEQNSDNRYIVRPTYHKPHILNGYETLVYILKTQNKWPPSKKELFKELFKELLQQPKIDTILSLPAQALFAFMFPNYNRELPDISKFINIFIDQLINKPKYDVGKTQSKKEPA